MKCRHYFISLSVIAAMAALTSCTNDDITKPIITLQGPNPQVVVYKSATEYVDPGYNAVDETDGEVTVSVYGLVNLSSAGEQTILYKATDEAGNTAVAQRIVIVDAAQYLAGVYKVVDVNEEFTSPEYIDSIRVSPVQYNKIYFTRFGYMNNAGAFATIAGSQIDLPQQNIYCGTPTAYYEFSGFGSFSDTSILMTYTRVKDNIPVAGTGSYIRQ